MVAAGNQVYVFDDRLYVVDVSDPTSPAEAAIYGLPATVVVEGDCVYLIDGSLSVVGGSRFVAPADDFNLPISGVVKAQDGYIYYPKGDDGLLIFRLVSPVTTCSSDGRQCAVGKLGVRSRNRSVASQRAVKSKNRQLIICLTGCASVGSK